jgi:hypothetical protein
MFEQTRGLVSPPEVIARFDELFERRYPSATPESVALLERICSSWRAQNRAAAARLVAIGELQLRTTWVDVDIARKLLYADCDDHTIAAAFDRLRPQSAYPFTAPLPLAEYPSCNKRAIAFVAMVYASPHQSLCRR